MSANGAKCRHDLSTGGAAKPGYVPISARSPAASTSASQSRTVARAGAKTKRGDAYAAYRGWCVEHGKVPVSLTAFGSTMKAKPEDGGCGVTYFEPGRSKRGFYLGLVVVAGPRLAVSNT
jgi:hypothetical protein